MGILSWIVVGIIAGWAAGLVMRGRGFGLFGNIIIGVIGAFIGGWLAGVIFGIGNTISGINIETIITAFLGAVVVLAVTGLLRR
jgi:uncharacterized membrane protein YeaQ/YmgE (transglycosylase-associated protein family)